MSVFELAIITLAPSGLLAGILLVRAARGRPMLIRWSGRISGFLLTTSGTLACLLLLSERACTERLPSVVSPDSTHLAMVSSVNGGATESWHTSVEVRSSWRPFSRMVFSSQDAPGDVHLNWLSNSHLLIVTPGNPQEPVDPEYSCSSALNVDVTCKVDWSVHH